MEPTPQNRGWRRTVTWLRFALKGGRIARFLVYAVNRFIDDRGPTQAASLSYASLLAMVPLLAVGLSFLAGFPAFEAWRVSLQQFAFRSFLPDTGMEISKQIAIFVENAGRLTATGLFALVVTSVLLLADIQGSFNEIWRVTTPRSWRSRLLVYWTLLTLGPMLIGASLSVSSYAFARLEWFDQAGLAASAIVARVVSTLLATLGFTLMYLVVPHRSVRISHALVGGAAAAVAFELLKWGFGLYLRKFPSYQLVYGAVAAVPIFLVWMYLSWVVILVGAQIAAALPEWRATQARGKAQVEPGGLLALMLSILARLADASITGRKLTERDLGRHLPATPAELDIALRRLRRAGFIDRSRGNHWLLARDLNTVTLRALMDGVRLGPASGHGWHPDAEMAVARLVKASRPELVKTIAAALAESHAEREEADRAAEAKSADDGQGEDREARAPPARRVSAADRPSRRIS